MSSNHLQLPIAQNFVQFCLENQVLKFGDFVLKSGIRSEYFFSLGEINQADQLSKLSSYYCALINSLYAPQEYDVIFGAAYKGIPICVSTSLYFFNKLNINKPFSFNRKEVKDHGYDKNSAIVGKDLSGLRVLVVDDVFTKGTALQQTFDLLKAYNAKIVGCFVALDRMEPNHLDQTKTTKETIEENNKVKIHSIINLDNVIDYLEVQQQSTTDQKSYLQLALHSMRKTRQLTKK